PNGAGLALTQFQVSPPSAAVTAPRGRESSIQTVLVRVPPLPPPVVVGGGVVPPEPEPAPLPAASQVTRPLKALKAMPRMLLPSSPTWLAGTSRRTHWPAAGSAPM